MTRTAVNVLIVLAIAALVVLIPGGGKGANTAIQAVYLVFLGSFLWAGSVMYRQYRTEIYSLGNAWRAALYAAVGLVVITLAAGARLRASGAGTVVFFALLVLAGGLGFSVWQASRRY